MTEIPRTQITETADSLRRYLTALALIVHHENPDFAHEQIVIRWQGSHFTCGNEPLPEEKR